MGKFNHFCVLTTLVIVAASQLVSCSSLAEQQQQQRQQASVVVGALQAAQASSDSATPGHQEESYQRVYEAFTKLLQNVSNNSLGNARRLVSRLNQLVGPAGQAQVQATTASAATAKPEVTREQQQQKQQQQQQQQQQNADEKTEQILNRLDQVNKNTDPHTLRQLQEDVNRLVGTLSESYLRNVRRVIERVNRTIGSGAVAPASPEAATSSGSTGPAVAAAAVVLHQSGDRYTEDSNGVKQPGFPGWDELITAVDRVQKSLASFVRSSTKLITSG